MTDRSELAGPAPDGRPGSTGPRSPDPGPGTVGGVGQPAVPARIVLQAHATRSATALALLLHARERGPRDLRRPFAALMASAVLALVIVVAVTVGTRVSMMLQH